MQLLLEAFDVTEDTQSSPHSNSAEYQRGYSEGFTAAESAAVADQEKLHAELVQSIADSLFSFDEARLHVLTSLGPLFEMVLARLLPATLSQSLRDSLHDMIIEAADADASHPALIRLNPDQIDTVNDVLGAVAHPNLKLIPDRTCGLNAAHASTAQGETAFDLDHALAQIAQIFAALPEQTKRTP